MSAAPFALRNYADDQCLAGHGRDAHMVLRGCTGSAGQDWHWGQENPDDMGFYQIVADGQNCLGLADDRTSPGTPVVVRRCAGSGDANQFWQPAKSYAACTKRSTRYFLLVNLRAVESPTDAALVIGAHAGGTTDRVVALGQWAGQCNGEYWAPTG
jgi:hypothetical protein